MENTNLNNINENVSEPKTDNTVVVLSGTKNKASRIFWLVGLLVFVVVIIGFFMYAKDSNFTNLFNNTSDIDLSSYEEVNEVEDFDNNFSVALNVINEYADAYCRVYGAGYKECSPERKAEIIDNLQASISTFDDDTLLLFMDAYRSRTLVEQEKWLKHLEKEKLPKTREAVVSYVESISPEYLNLDCSVMNNCQTEIPRAYLDDLKNASCIYQCIMNTANRMDDSIAGWKYFDRKKWQALSAKMGRDVVADGIPHALKRYEKICQEKGNCSQLERQLFERLLKTNLSYLGRSASQIEIDEQASEILYIFKKNFTEEEIQKELDSLDGKNVVKKEPEVEHALPVIDPNENYVNTSSVQITEGSSEQTDKEVVYKLALLRAEGELYYDSNEAYSKAKNASYPINNCLLKDSVFVSENFVNTLDFVKKSTNNSPTCTATGTNGGKIEYWAISAKLISEESWCVDNMGHSQYGVAVAGACK